MISRLPKECNRRINLPKSGKLFWEVNTVKKKPIQTDPQGSYTGRPEDRDEVPVQDADDL